LRLYTGTYKYLYRPRRPLFHDRLDRGRTIRQHHLCSLERLRQGDCLSVRQRGHRRTDRCLVLCPDRWYRYATTDGGWVRQGDSDCFGTNGIGLKRSAPDLHQMSPSFLESIFTTATYGNENQKTPIYWGFSCGRNRTRTCDHICVRDVL
jgi:hypothetical protein